MLVVTVTAHRRDEESACSCLPADSRLAGGVLPAVVGGGRGSQALGLEAVGALHPVHEVGRGQGEMPDWLIG